MIIEREKAVSRIASGEARFDGCTTDNEGFLCWVITDYVLCRVDHVRIWDNESLVGCFECGTLVTPEADVSGCGCHCPDCKSTL
jgi:hypothetical protein